MVSSSTIHRSSPIPDPLESMERQDLSALEGLRLQLLGANPVRDTTLNRVLEWADSYNQIKHPALAQASLDCLAETLKHCQVMRDFNQEKFKTRDGTVNATVVDLAWREWLDQAGVIVNGLFKIYCTAEAHAQNPAETAQVKAAIVDTFNRAVKTCDIAFDQLRLNTFSGNGKGLNTNRADAIKLLGEIVFDPTGDGRSLTNNYRAMTYIDLYNGAKDQKQVAWTDCLRMGSTIFAEARTELLRASVLYGVRVSTLSLFDPRSMYRVGKAVFDEVNQAYAETMKRITERHPSAERQVFRWPRIASEGTGR